ncbi:MAG: hypothetical protein HY755_05685 [Nitrospirae bacterium]|nr:hypothetical protein [Nitrospirota bacterium]
MNPVRHSEDKEMTISKEKTLHMSNGMKDIVNDMIFSYEARIQSMEAIFDATHQILQGFQDSFLDARQEEKLTSELRETLAKDKSLRKKDFDNMMQGILSAQEERKKEVRNLLKGYLNGQKEVAQTLKDNLAKVKDVLVRGETGRVKEFQGLIKEILAKQDERKDEVTSKLKEFQKEQHEMAKRLKELLTKGRELRIKDLKLMLKEFNAQYKERIACQKERREDVCSMLGEFKKERIKKVRRSKTPFREELINLTE